MFMAILHLAAFILVVKIKIVHAAWVHDGTWPAGAMAPDSDDILLDNEESPFEPLQSCSSGVTAPWLAINRGDVKLDSEESVSGIAEC
jgi:hypothetical protein